MSSCPIILSSCSHYAERYLGAIASLQSAFRPPCPTQPALVGRSDRRPTSEAVDLVG